ncbi:MAG: DUF4349 domain-containing protein [Anaerofustis sp.]
MNNNTSGTCDDRWKEWISRHLDGDLNEEETEELQAHFRECDSCFRYYAQMNRLKHALDTLPKEDWHDAWTEETVKRFKRGKWKKLDLKRIVWLSAAILVVAVFAVSFVQQIVLTGGNSAEYGTIGSAAPENGGLAVSDTNKGTDSSASGSGYASGAGSTDAAPMSASEIDPDKIIYSGTLSLYAGNLKQTITDISVYVQSIGGFVESSYYSLNTDASYEYSSYGTVQLRVPVEQYDAAMQTLQSYGKVASSYTYSENVTQSYRDVQSELDSYRIQEGKLNELLKQAGSVSDMLSIETELNRIRTEIDTREAILQNYDNLIAYSSITVTLYEQDISSANIQSPFGNLWQNIKEAFIKSVNIFLTAIEKLILIIFYLLPFAFAAAVIVIIVRLARRKKGLLPPKTKNAEQSESVEESADTQNEPKK